ncbi:amino acid--tRNA ligase-related protein [Dactylosporangium sp. CA-092794]|uniref:amino acid--tRNA ligase-related protein n=1 Tax=Dactylosporangium sp. CA-092794 TaxID=3239929 RepID=UPI003D8B2BE6
MRHPHRPPASGGRGGPSVRDPPQSADEGIGIDRFIALLTDSPNLRDVVLFPSMRRDAGGAAAQS